MANSLKVSDLCPGPKARGTLPIALTSTPQQKSKSVMREGVLVSGLTMNEGGCRVVPVMGCQAALGLDFCCFYIAT